MATRLVASSAVRRLGLAVVAVAAMAPFPGPVASAADAEPRLEELIRGGYSASGGDPLFLVKSPLALGFLVASVAILALAGRRRERKSRAITDSTL